MVSISCSRTSCSPPTLSSPTPPGVWRSMPHSDGGVNPLRACAKSLHERQTPEGMMGKNQAKLNRSPRCRMRSISLNKEFQSQHLCAPWLLCPLCIVLAWMARSSSTVRSWAAYPSVFMATASRSRSFKLSSERKGFLRIRWRRISALCACKATHHF